jgi:putative heme iron utilization protein
VSTNQPSASGNDVTPRPLAPETAERIRAALRKSPNQMTLQLARDLGVPEVEVIRCFPDGRAVELDVTRWEEIIRAFQLLGTVHVIISNGCVTSEVVGQFGRFSTAGEFFNVQSKTIDMHIRWRQLGAVFAVEKPGHLDGVNTLSVQFYDKSGASAFKVFLTFGGSVPAPERVLQFSELRERFRLDR